MYDDIGYLISETEAENTIGDTIRTPESRLIYINRKGVRQSEHYQAAAVGLKPELMFEMRRSEYDGETKFKYQDKTYEIIRIHEKDQDFIEVVCEGKVNENATT